MSLFVRTFFSPQSLERQGFQVRDQSTNILSSETFFLSFNTFIYLFIYFWLRWVFVAARGLSLVAVSGGYSSLWCVGFSLRWLLLLRNMGSRARRLQQLQHVGSVVVAHGLQNAGSVVVAHGLSCSAACGIFPDQGSNLCPLHWQVDSQPLRHQGSPSSVTLFVPSKLLIQETSSCHYWLPQSILKPYHTFYMIFHSVVIQVCLRSGQFEKVITKN